MNIVFPHKNKLITLPHAIELKIMNDYNEGSFIEFSVFKNGAEITIKMPLLKVTHVNLEGTDYIILPVDLTKLLTDEQIDLTPHYKAMKRGRKFTESSEI